jgi:molecular chaperone DnaK (HSP70)
VFQIEVTFDIDVDGILSVKLEKRTGVEQSVTIQGASN